jgi:DNA invertase Pin-like site-specific DNA recombinase
MSTPAVCYYRMSTDAQEASIPAHRDWAHKAAPREGCRIVSEFDDPGIAGGVVEHRPGLQRLLDFCDRQFQQGTPVEAVLIWNPDRLSRADSLKTSAVLSRLKDAGVCRLLTASDGWVDLDDVTHRVLYFLKQDLARANFCKDLAKNTLRGKSQLAADGFWAGGVPPLGYRLRATAGPGPAPAPGRRRPPLAKLEPDPETADVVRWLFRTYAAGAHGTYDLCRELERRKVPPVRERLRRERGEPAREIRWNRSALHAVFINPAYLGHTCWNLRRRGCYARLAGGQPGDDDTAKAREQHRRRRGLRQLAEVRNDAADVIEVRDTHPPLVDQATFNAVQSRLVINKRLTIPVRGGGPWLLTGLVRCGTCGRPMHGQTGVGYKGKPIQYYRCSGSKAYRCPAVKFVRQSFLVEEIVAELKERFAEGPALDAISAKVAWLAARGRKDADAERARLRAAAGELDAKIRQGNANLALLPPDRLPGVVAQVRNWEGERDRISQEMARLDGAAEAHEGTAERVDAALAHLRRLGDTVAQADPAEVRAALAGVVSRVTVHLGKAGRTRDVAVSAIEVEMHGGLVGLFTTGSRRGPTAARSWRAAPPGRAGTPPGR